MAGRFPLYIDADVQGQVVKALRDAGWDVLRAIEAFPERTKDPVHFERAAQLGRVLVANDEGQRQRGANWYAEGRTFAGVIWWPQTDYEKRTPGDFLRAFEELAQKDAPFSPYPVVFLITKRG